MSCIEELFSVLAKNPGCHSDLHARFLPVAVEILTSNESQLPLGLAVVSQIMNFELCNHINMLYRLFWIYLFML